MTGAFQVDTLNQSSVEGYKENLSKIFILKLTTFRSIGVCEYLKENESVVSRLLAFKAPVIENK